LCKNLRTEELELLMQQCFNSLRSLEELDKLDKKFDINQLKIQLADYVKFIHNEIDSNKQEGNYCDKN
jgi:hypothetical protein